MNSSGSYGDKWYVILCSGAEHLDEEFLRRGFRTVRGDRNYDDSRTFSNSDVYTRLSNVRRFEDKKVCIVQTFTCSGENSMFNFSTGDRIAEVLQVLDILRNPTETIYDQKGKRRHRYAKPPRQIVLLALHLGFSKQDQVYRTGESNSCKLLIDLFLREGVSKIVTVDPHPPRDFSWMQGLKSAGRLQILSMYDRVIKSIRQDIGLDDLILVSTPGKKRADLAFELTEIEKQRIRTTKVRMKGKIGSFLQGKRVFMIDDMVISGTTIKNARKLLLDGGVEDVYCWVTHALPLSGGNEDNLRNVVREFQEKIFVSNTVRTKTFTQEYPYCSYSCVPLIIDEFFEKEDFTLFGNTG